ncbi:variant 2, galacturonosyltransferase 13 [Lathyrus oleraceus]|uniref:Hexosyltransferase n=1 Tax=Pisum sativum TaxID=3888 RepID=A0A9D5BFS9_PEA|nr:variant 2, galacturonosyltransferase 13 [Pisum sativum]
MQLHFSPSMRSITISSNNGFIDLMKIKVAACHISYRTLFHTILVLAFLLPFVFILTAVVTLEGVNKCSSLDCLGRRLGPRLLGRADNSARLVKDFYNILNEVKTGEIPSSLKLPDSFDQMVSSMKDNQYDAKTFALMLKGMMQKFEKEVRESKFAELMNKHFAASSIPKGINCLSLRLTDEYSSNAHARKQLPPPELLPMLSDNSYHHFILSTDNILAASVVVASTVQSSQRPEKIVFHVITDKKTYAGMHSWFALNPPSPAIVEVKGLHQFDWLTRENVPLFPNLEKVVFLDDDVVVQRDLSPLWEIDMNGKVNGAVETCRGEDDWVMSKHLKNYFNFSHPLIAGHLDPDECAWAYGMNVFDLRTWRTSNIRETYHSWLKENLRSNMTMWKLGTLPPALIAFKGHVYPIDPAWHMLGLGYQTSTNVEDVKTAAVIHYNGQSKPWLEIGFEHLRPFWNKYVNYSNDFVRNCNIMDL